MTPNKDQSSSSQPDRKPNPLDRLRGHRVYADRARSIVDDIASEMRTMKKVSKNESAATQAWTTVVPDLINDCSQIAGLKAGKLIVHVPSAAHRHVVDRWLKSGGFREFQALARVPIQGVTLKINAPHTDSGS